MRKLKGLDEGKLYAMKVLEKVKVMQKKKTTEHTRTEREVLEKIIDSPFLAKMYYAFQTPEKLYLVLGFEQGGELFTHLYKSEHFSEAQVRFYIAEIIVALEQLHQVTINFEIVMNISYYCVEFVSKSRIYLKLSNSFKIVQFFLIASSHLSRYKARKHSVGRWRSHSHH